MKKISFVILFALLISCLPTQKTFALSCAQPPKPEVAIHKYDVVVIATVTETDANSPDKSIKTVKADVSHTFKGYNDSTITFTEDKVWGESLVGKEYLLFLNSKDNRYESPLCSPTKLTASLDKDALIEKLTAEVETGTTTTNETIVTTPTVVESVITDESNNESSWKWSVSIATPVILILLLAIFFYRRGKAKQIG